MELVFDGAIEKNVLFESSFSEDDPLVFEVFSILCLVRIANVVFEPVMIPCRVRPFCLENAEYMVTFDQLVEGREKRKRLVRLSLY